MVMGSEKNRPTAFGSEVIPAVALTQKSNTEVTPKIVSRYLAIFFIVLFLIFAQAYPLELVAASRSFSDFIYVVRLVTRSPYREAF